MGAINLTETLIGREVERLFSKNPARSGDHCRNPVTGAGYVRGADPIGPQKKAAYRALLAREWFALNGPPDVQPLPVSYHERESLKGQGLFAHIVAWYARSLADRNYDVKEHPPFADYVCGVYGSRTYCR